jgi:hypothetical protein
LCERGARRDAATIDATMARTTSVTPRPLVGVDFTSRPTRAKPITAAFGEREDAWLRLERIESFDTIDAFANWLKAPGQWLGGFDLPFGLSRELVVALGWPTDWLALMRHVAALPRERLRAHFAAYCAARPAGAKFARRACEAPAGSSPSMKWVNPPVAYMLHAGVPLLIDAGASLPAHAHAGDARRIALEAYPGLLAREAIGRRSYKSDERAKQNAERRLARKDCIDAIERGATRLGLLLALTRAQRESLLEDAQGDRLDAVLCLAQAAWASAVPRYGLPERVDPLEGWIVTA